MDRDTNGRGSKKFDPNKIDWSKIEEPRSIKALFDRAKRIENLKQGVMAGVRTAVELYGTYAVFASKEQCEEMRTMVNEINKKARELIDLTCSIEMNIIF